MAPPTDDDDDDDSFASDIATRLQSAHQNLDDDDDDDDDRSSDEEDDDRPRKRSAPRTAMGSVKKANSQSTKPLNTSTNAVVDLLGSDDDDDDDDDDELMALTKKAPAHRSKTTTSTSPINRLLLDDDDDDDDDDYDEQVNIKLQTSRYLQAHQGTLGSLSKLQQAKDALRIAQMNQVNDIERDVTYDSLLSHRQQSMDRQVVCVLQVVPQWEDGAASSGTPDLPPRMVLRVANHQLVQVLVDQVWKHAPWLDPKKYTIALRCQGQVLDPHRPLSKYTALTEEGAEISATIYSSLLLQGANTKHKKKPARMLGRSIQLKLRRNDTGEEQVVSTFQKETFAEIVTKYQTVSNIPSTAKLVLWFDGEALAGNDTPAVQDMEDHDLIEVKIG